MLKALKTLGLAMIGLYLLTGSYSSAAAAPADFYKGKTVTLVVGEKPGGGSDLTARVVARHLSKLLGATIIVVNKTGAAHMESFHAIWNAKPDGLTIGCEDLPSLVTNDLQDAPGVHYQAEKYTFYGGIADEEVIFWVSATGPMKSIQDLKAGKNLKLVATSVSGMRAINQLVVAYLLDLDAKVITGLKGSKECDLAIMQGEATGTTSSPASYKLGVKGGTHRGLFTVDVRRNEGVPDVPALTELVKLPEEKLNLLKLMVTLRPNKTIYGPPAVPKERVEFLRKAFNDMTRQADFKTDVERIQYPGVPFVKGEELAARATAAKKNKKMWQDQFKVLFDKYRG